MPVADTETTGAIIALIESSWGSASTLLTTMNSIPVPAGEIL